jgi:peroxiredoxin
MDALAPGTTFPDLELADHAGNPRRLADLVGGDPTLVHFHRGWWCPKEQTFLRGLVRLQDEAEVAYTRFVSVSVDPPEVSSAFRAGLGARWTFLCDPEHGRPPSCSGRTSPSTPRGTATGSGAGPPARSCARRSAR